MKKADKLIDLSYVLGMALIISAIIYFFAANWPGFGRGTKVLLSVGLMTLFYALSLAIAPLKQRKLLSTLLLFSGCFAFGVSLALLGQIYNSHANSYTLFMVWFVPAFLFSLLTRLQSFHVLSYLLFHLSLWFYLFPSSIVIDYGEERLMFTLLLFALLNGLLFLSVFKGYIDSKPLAYLSLIVFHLFFMPLTNSFLFDNWLLLNFVYLLLLLGQIVYFMTHEQRNFLFIAGCAAFVYALLTFIELSIIYFSVGFYLFALLFVILLMIGNIFLLKWLSKKIKQRNEKGYTLWEKLLIGLTTAVAAWIATSSLLGIISLWIEDFPTYLYMLIAAFVFILPMIYAKSLNPIIRYTLLFVGYLLGMWTNWEQPLAVNLLYVLLIGFSWFSIPNRYVRWVAYSAANLHLLFSLFSVQISSEGIFLSLLLVNGCLYLFSRARAKCSWSYILNQNSLAYTLLSFFVLTFIKSQWSFMYYLYNLLFFLLVTWLIYWAVKQEKRYESILSFCFWFMFLAYKYYDLLWKLLHKSIALAILGLVFTALAIWLDRRYAVPKTSVQPGLIQKKLSLIIVIMLLQFTILGGQIAKSEYLLASGETIKLELVPVDPRSLIQGDYVRLRYAISTVEIEESLSPREKVQLVLAPNEQGVYEFPGIYKYKGAFNQDYLPSANDVLINARYAGERNVVFGIESYFVPEGTGRQVEREAKFAYVRVGSNGDALLERLAAE